MNFFFREPRAVANNELARTGYDVGHGRDYMLVVDLVMLFAAMVCLAEN